MVLAALPPDYGMARCPFCCGDRVRVHEWNAHGTRFRVICLRDGCGVGGPVRFDAKEAMNAWNERRDTSLVVRWVP